jgi:hypothetical protein
MGSTIPASWQQQLGGRLRALELRNLNLTGGLPAWLNNITVASPPNLVQLAVTGNPNLVGELPVEWASNGGTHAFQSLNLSGNGLTGGRVTSAVGML